MPIDPTRLSDVGPRPPQAPGGVAGDRPAPAPAPPRGDVVEISDEARALAEQGGADRVPLTEARLSEIRDRLASGYYGNAEIAREVVERILDAGDV